MNEGFQLVLTCIGNIKAFEGDVNELPDFLEQVENILPIFERFDEANKRVLFGYLKNKCIGRTRVIIHRYGNVVAWEILKGILLDNFGEKQTSNELMDKLKTCTLDSTIEKYHYNINKIRNRLHNRLLTHGNEGFTTAEINRISLHIFREKLPEPTKTLIFARNPVNLETAFKIITEARHQGYTQYGPPHYRNPPRNHTRSNFSDNINNNHFTNDYYNKRDPNNGHNGHHGQNNNKYSHQNKSNQDNNQQVKSYVFNKTQQRYNNNNKNNYNSNNTNYNKSQQNSDNQNENTSRNTRRTNQNYRNESTQSKRSNEHEPMDINNTESNFLEEVSRNFLI